MSQRSWAFPMKLAWGTNHQNAEIWEGRKLCGGESEWGLGSEGRGRHALWPARPGEGADAVRSSVETVAGEQGRGRAGRRLSLERAGARNATGRKDYDCFTGRNDTTRKTGNDEKKASVSVGRALPRRQPTETVPDRLLCTHTAAGGGQG